MTPDLHLNALVCLLVLPSLYMAFYIPEDRQQYPQLTQKRGQTDPLLRVERAPSARQVLADEDRIGRDSYSENMKRFADTLSEVGLRRLIQGMRQVGVQKKSGERPTLADLVKKRIYYCTDDVFCRRRRRRNAQIVV